MGLTGVIYAAIVVAWAIFLVPLALRRHDQTARNRSIERFSSTMRVLSTSGRRVGSRVVLTPKRGTDRPAPAESLPSTAGSTAAAERRPAGATEDKSHARPVSRPRARAAAARRRQVLRILVALTLLTGVVSLLGIVPAGSVVVPLAIIVGFLVLARRQVRLANEAYWEQASAARPAASNVVRRSAARVDASHGVTRSTAGVDAEDEGPSTEEEHAPADDEPTVTLTVEQLAAGAAVLAQQRTVAVSLATADGGSLWDPLPMTLPTYVGQAVARRSVRNISLGEPGSWSSGHSPAVTPAVTDAQAADDRATGSSGAADDADLAEEGQRAANA